MEGGRQTSRSSFNKDNNERLVELCVHMKRLLHIIEGNGKSGLIDRVSCLENDVRDTKDSIAAIDRHVREHDVSSNKYIDIIEELQRSLTKHFEEDAKARKILEERSAVRATWWNRIGLEVMKMLVSAIGAVLIAYLLFNLKLGG